MSSGPFSKLSADETLSILTRLPLEDLVTCVTRVCTGWRSFQTNPGAFRRIEVAPQRGGAASRWLSASGLFRLLARLADTAARVRGCSRAAPPPRSAPAGRDAVRRRRRGR